jgi:hypothetical protein
VLAFAKLLFKVVIKLTIVYMIRNILSLIIIVVLLSGVANCSKKDGENNTNPVVDTSVQQISVDVTKVISTNFSGFGTQYNQNLYSTFSSTDGVTSSNIGQLETKVKSLKSQYVRIFFDSKAWPTDPNYSSTTADFMNSFIKTVKLAQDAGATTINITFWHTATAAQMPAFADVLKELIVRQGLSAVKEVTIQNEPNSTSMTMDTYKACYVALDNALNNLGIRNQIHFVGGDLVQTNQQDWFTYMGTNMSDLLSGYSSHIYWDDNDASKPITRLTGIADIVKGLSTAIKPVYITEYGVRGGSKTGVPDPGNLTGTTTPISQTTVSAMQNALFQINGLNSGFAGFIRWDCYKAKYDNGSQYFSCIGSGTDGYPLYPLYYMTWLFTHTSQAGWQVVSTNPGTVNSGVVVASMTNSNASEQTIYVINTSSHNVTYSLGGLIPNKRYIVCSFNNKGNGQLEKLYVTSGNDGTVRQIGIPNSLVAITTLDLTLP